MIAVAEKDALGRGQGIKMGTNSFRGKPAVVMTILNVYNKNNLNECYR